ncbi:hypothetical protein [Chitiniphilus eburneus]|uniref:Uncharacterized protein n=1 Tax=Chitiniphilus eburneus TaxID=2571148 RepID=A0A4U0Q7W4_9NEIS|nr:hypothetical protein [Chitiniphilus eburneus]TJZ77337.1 hypothetical protein FAZ21_03070 [Chitiniphilus eburneus]
MWDGFSNCNCDSCDEGYRSGEFRCGYYLFWVLFVFYLQIQTASHCIATGADFLGAKEKEVGGECGGKDRSASLVETDANNGRVLFFVMWVSFAVGMMTT